MESLPEDEMSDRARLTIWALSWLGYAVLGFIYFESMWAIRLHHAGVAAAAGATAAFMTAMFGLHFGMTLWWGRLSRHKATPAFSRYNRRQLVAFGAYCALLFVAIWAKVGWHFTGAAAIVVAVLPALPLVGIIAAMGVYLREETDEFQRAMHVQSALWATAGALSIATVWGFLEMLAGLQHVPGWAWFPVWWCLFALANMLIRRRFR